MAITVSPFETTGFTLSDNAWEPDFNTFGGTYKQVLIGPGYIYDQSKFTFADISAYTLGNAEAISDAGREITIDSTGANTILRSGNLGWETNAQSYDAIGIMLFLSPTSATLNSDQLFLWIAFGETLTFNTTDGLDGSGGLYYFNNGLF